MITIRQIERLFNDQQWPRLYHELIANRPESLSLTIQSSATPPRVPPVFPLHHATQCNTMQHFSRSHSMQHLPALCGVVPTAAMALIRIDELTQCHHPFYRRLLNVILTTQQKDGGWGDPLVTALCLRALVAGAGSGAAVNGGLGYLAILQKIEGAWPKDPLRRLPADGFTSAFILHQLGEFACFRNAVRFDDAITWFTTHATHLDDQTQRLWLHAKTRCRLATTHRPAPLFSPRPAA